MPEGTDSNAAEPTAANSLSGLIGQLEPAVARIMDNALDGGDISVEDAVALFDTTGAEFAAMGMVADELRRRTVGDLVTYVVNRNINFTNVCI
jgi:FO synthase subunit 2